jgi:acyl-CoA thioester hydrolase
MSRPVLPIREDYPHFLAIPTRWNDNDTYGHVNNAVYYYFIDTVVNSYLIVSFSALLNIRILSMRGCV